MHWIVPFIMVFGFLVGNITRDASFTMLMPVLAAGALLPLVVSLVRERQWPLIGMLAAVAIVLALATTIPFAAFAVAIGGGASVLTAHYGKRLGSRLVLAGVAGLMMAFVVEPAGLALGLWHYSDFGLYYGLPPMVMLTWFSATALGAVGGLRVLGANRAMPLEAVKSTLVVLAFATGVCTAFSLWPPALLGLLLLQFGFHVLNYL